MSPFLVLHPLPPMPMDELFGRMLVLPTDLQAAIKQALATTTPARWQREAQALSERYRAPRTEASEPLATGTAQALGYAALILPATYAQLRGAFAATAARIPHWQPQSLLDLGSGPGTALWAAIAQWPTLQHLVAWEREAAFVTLGRMLARQSESLAVRQAQWEQIDLQTLRGRAKRCYDLVILGHVLNELPPASQQQLIAWAWQQTSGLLLLVEPGTQAAFGVVRTARDQLLAAGAHTIAPCAHDQPCPLRNDWCHFPQRLKRPDFQRQARGAPSEWEDSKFAYAAMAHFAPDEPIWGRVIREPSSNKAYAESWISTQAGVARYRGPKRHRDAYRLVRDLEWGTALAEPLPPPIAAIPVSEVPTDHDPS